MCAWHRVDACVASCVRGTVWMCVWHRVCVPPCGCVRGTVWAWHRVDVCVAPCGCVRGTVCACAWHRVHVCVVPCARVRGTVCTCAFARVHVCVCTCACACALRGAAQRGISVITDCSRAHSQQNWYNNIASTDSTQAEPRLCVISTDGANAVPPSVFHNTVAFVSHIKYVGYFLLVILVSQCPHQSFQQPKSLHLASVHFATHLPFYVIFSAFFFFCT